MIDFFPFIYEKKKKADPEYIQEYIELIPPSQEEKIEEEPERVIILEIL